MAWQVQEAKQRFSEVLRRAATEGEQIVTRHGEEVAAVVDITEFRRLKEKSEKATPRHPGLFPPLVDDEIAEILDSIVADRAKGDNSSRVIPDFED